MVNKLTHFLKVFNSEEDVESSKLPTEIKLFNVGENNTSHGVFIYDPTKKEMLVHPNGWDKLSIDVDHLSFSEQTTPELRGSFGWFKLEANDDGIFAKDIEFCERMKPLLEDRAYRFVSPAFNCFKDTNIISEIINIALTNIPATINMTPIIATSNITEKDIMKTTPKVKTKLSKLAEEETPVADDSSDVVEETEVETTPEDDKKAIAELSAMLEAANQKILTLEKEISDYSAAMEEEEKLSELNKLNISDAEVKFLSKMSLGDIKELVSIRLSNKQPDLVEKETLKHKFLSKKGVVPAEVKETSFSKDAAFEKDLETHLLSVRAKAQAAAAKFSFKK